jgi:hypothetical protein
LQSFFSSSVLLLLPHLAVVAVLLAPTAAVTAGVDFDYHDLTQQNHRHLMRMMTLLLSSAAFN